MSAAQHWFYSPKVINTVGMGARRHLMRVIYSPEESGTDVELELDVGSLISLLRSRDEEASRFSYYAYLNPEDDYLDLWHLGKGIWQVEHYGNWHGLALTSLKQIQELLRESEAAPLTPDTFDKIMNRGPVR